MTEPDDTPRPRITARELVERQWPGLLDDPPPEPPRRVVVVDASMPFGSMVAFALRWAAASIPATFALGVFWGLMYLLWGVIRANLGT